IFEKEFKGMIAEDIPFKALETTRNDLVEILREELTPDERRFIVSMKKGRPKWDLLALEGVENLPAVKWKLLNISRMDPAKHQKAVRKLKDYLGV
ncbi:MAG: nucleotidyl transferase AbiEii/AbiGii toxin family protein, partial [Thermodesulfobacteriota bacterium]